MTKRMPKTVTERGQLYLYAKSEERKNLLEHVRDSFPDARSLSDAVFQALSDWKDYAETGKTLRPALDVFGELIPLARVYLRLLDDEDFRLAVYESLVKALLHLFRETIVEHQLVLLGFSLSEEEVAVLSPSSRGIDAEQTEFWKSVRDLAEHDKDMSLAAEWIFTFVEEESGHLSLARPIPIKPKDEGGDSNEVEF